MEQLNRLLQFRQVLFDELFARERNALFELLDALLLSPHVRSFPYLTLSPVFRRQWPSAYAALERGQIDPVKLEQYLTGLLPQDRPVCLFGLDESAWPRPDAPTLTDRGFVHGARATTDGRGIVIGHSYSSLAYVAEAGSSWALPLSIKRVASESDALEVGLDQIERLSRQRIEAKSLDIIMADRRYGNHRFFGRVPEMGKLVRLRANRVLYRRAGAYRGFGRPSVHGAAFRFKDCSTWGEPEQMLRFEDARFGEVELRMWHQLHAKEDAKTEFSLIMARIHLEKAHPPQPLWLAWKAPSGESQHCLPVVTLWRFYQERASMEACFRFRKQALCWTMPKGSSLEAAGCWTDLVTLAQWTLYLARAVVSEVCLPWQKEQQVELTPGRVQQSLGGLLAQIGTEAAPPKRRGKSPGWPVGKPRGRRDRFAVVRKRKKKPQKTTRKR